MRVSRNSREGNNKVSKDMMQPVSVSMTLSAAERKLIFVAQSVRVRTDIMDR